MISIITPTGDRPQAFALCEHWFSKQTFLQGKEPWEWIVVDDGLYQTKCMLGQTLLRRIDYNMHLGLSSLGKNLAAGLAIARGNSIVIMEDDDYYGPRYVENTLLALKTTRLVGETPSRYFHVGFRVFKEWNNTTQASLCQTAFRSDCIPLVLPLCSQNRFIDMTLWQQTGTKIGHLYAGNQVVGIKGMPGRPGISGAHKVEGTGWQGDIDLARLRQWIGTDAERYREYGTI